MFASTWANKTTKILSMISDFHVFPLRYVVFEPIPHSQDVLLGTNDRSQIHDTLAWFEGEAINYPKHIEQFGTRN